MELQRYIVGRPNLLCVNVQAVQEDRSPHFNAGCEFSQPVRHLWVWCFDDVYSPQIEIDCKMLSPNMPIKIGDVEKMLPYGMYLHKKYNSMKFTSVVKMTPSNKYTQRKI